jgi:hypothetical protein
MWQSAGKIPLVELLQREAATYHPAARAPFFQFVPISSTNSHTVADGMFPSTVALVEAEARRLRPL